MADNAKLSSQMSISVTNPTDEMARLYHKAHTSSYSTVASDEFEGDQNVELLSKKEEHVPSSATPTDLLFAFLFCAISSILLAVFLTGFYFMAPVSTAATVPTCDIFCSGSVLKAFQLSGIFNDSKSFVDCPLTKDPADVLSAFINLPSTKYSELSTFFDQYFLVEGSDLNSWIPGDHVSAPAFLSNISDPRFYNFSVALNNLWLSLGKTIDPDVYVHPSRHTLLPLLHPHMIVPGGRFREFYYWDSYWIVRGLITSGMTSTAKMVVENLLDLVERYGFIPNGNRQYYLNRSQPPMLAMLIDYFVSAVDVDDKWLQNALIQLQHEYEWWMDSNHAVQLNASEKVHVVNRYFSKSTNPRPESYLEDLHSASLLRDNSTGAAKILFGELAASAESGWDFSSRWFADGLNLSTAYTSHIIPVDLNSIMYSVEVILSKLNNRTGNYQAGSKYYQLSQDRLETIHKFLWNETHNCWFDYNTITNQQQKGVYVSNFMPLWIKPYDSRVNESKVIDALILSDLIYVGGIVTSLTAIDQQWDFPNAWPPLQHMIIEGISTSRYVPEKSMLSERLLQMLAPQVETYEPIPRNAYTHQGRALAYYLAGRWLLSNEKAFNTYGGMWEKYYGPAVGVPGSQGEYTVQIGFGWSNGVSLALLSSYGPNLNYTAIESTLKTPPWIFDGATEVNVLTANVSKVERNVDSIAPLPDKIHEDEQKDRLDQRREKEKEIIVLNSTIT